MYTELWTFRPFTMSVYKSQNISARKVCSKAKSQKNVPEIIITLKALCTGTSNTSSC